MILRLGRPPPAARRTGAIGSPRADEDGPDLTATASATALTGQVPGLDGARALATLSVFSYHSLWRVPALEPLAPVLGHADIGVEVFFVLSGFLVARPLLAHAAAGGRRVGTIDFWRRRVARIWPAYLVALVGAVWVGIGTVDGGSGWLEHGLLVDSWYEDGPASIRS